MNTYVIRVYDSGFNGSYKDYDGKYCQSISIDPTKLVDDDFYSFEAKRTNIEMIYVEDIYSLFSDTSLLLRRQPFQYVGENSNQRDISQFINRRIDIVRNGITIFRGLPEYNSFSYEFKAKKMSFSVIEFAGILFDNIDKQDDLRAFLTNSIQQNKVGSGSNSLEPSYVLSEMFLPFYLKYPIDISSAFQIPGFPSDTNLSFTNDILWYEEKSDMVSAINSINTFSGFSIDDIYKYVPYEISFYRENNKIYFCEVQWFNVNTEFVGAQTWKGVLQFPCIRKVCVSFENNQANSMVVEEAKVQDIANWWRHSTVANGHHQEGKNATINIIQSDSEEENIVDVVRGVIDGWYQNQTKKTLQVPISLIFSTNDGATITINQGQKLINITGVIDVKLRLGVKDGIVDYSITDGIFNPDKFKAKEFFKSTILLTAQYITFENMYVWLTDILAYLQNEPIPINEKYCISVKNSQEFIDISAKMKSINYAETDKHWYCLAVLRKYVNLVSSFGRKLSLEIILIDQHKQISYGNIVLFKGVKYFVNSVTFSVGDTCELELIEILNNS